MEHKMGTYVDRALAIAALFLLLTAFFSAQMRNILWGLALAASVTLLLLYAWALWSRGKSGAKARRANAQWQLHNLMLSDRDVALRTAAELVAREHDISIGRAQGDYLHGTLAGRAVAIALLQRPLNSRVDSGEILALYHATCIDHLILLSTAPFTSEASIFAQQLKSPRVALIGPDKLAPLLGELPRDEEAYKRDSEKRRRATLGELRERASDPRRVRRYLIYGTAMLLAYVALNLWPFLIPGLACLFLAVIARRQSVKKEKLFPDA